VQGKLLEPAAKSSSPGPIYQGVCKQLRALFPPGDAEAQKRKNLNAGTIAQARSLAASIDRVSGHGSAYQAAGMQLSAMHQELDELLLRLAPADGKDAFDQWLEQLAEPEQQTQP
jgi:uncharacterized membrane protein YccC